jgi:hypothetical protein
MSNRPSSSTKFLAGSAIVVCFLAGASLCVAAPRGGSSVGRAVGGQTNSVGYGQSYYGYGGYGGYFSPYAGYQSVGPAYAYQPPDHWWTGYYASVDPRGPGYNPDAGYAWDSVTTLLLETFPIKARVTLDGVFVGTSDRLGPFQLPVGQHTLRVEAAGFEPSETVLKVEQPMVQQLNVRLSEVAHSAKPAPQR